MRNTFDGTNGRKNSMSTVEAGSDLAGESTSRAHHLGPAIILAVLYPVALFIGSGVGVAVVVALSETRAMAVGGGEWLAWSMPLFCGVFAGLFAGLLALVMRSRLTSSAWLIVWVWTGALVLLSAVWAWMAPPASVFEFVTDVPGGFWAITIGGLLGFALGLLRHSNVT